MSSIISILKERSSSNPDSLDAKIYILSNQIIKLAIEHQKRVIKIMPEFDLHDNTHLEKVEENIALLLGDSLLRKLSSIELFLLLAASYLHDCGMAPADWELSLMKMTEGYDSLQFSQGSICNDGKKPYTIREAKSFIEKNQQTLYDFEEVKKWEFAPNDENELKNTLSDMFVEYQKFRNGYIDKIKEAAKTNDYERLNQDIRVDYIRTYHHKRSAVYIKNLQKIAISILGDNWTQRLFSDLADVCESHGESIDFVRRLKKEVRYVDSNGVNLQFVSMMLRLGDIIHYSYDRAPSILRNAMSFQSEYSKNEWLIKVGLHYTIESGTITYMANCQLPKDYYHLQEYLDWVDKEISNFDLLKRGWQPKYQININEVDRSNVEYDRNIFIPVKNKKFTLVQNKIIELLMGVKLYKDPFASIRELYQNSLDACRCRLAIAEMERYSLTGEIEFGIESGNEGRFLYCKDNGIGMDEYVIENFLLKIGNSFYNSKDFYRKQSQWRASYTPVSQFGVGILSCFIIGNRIEIVTKSLETHKCMACCIDGTENFYYKMPSREDEEQISDCGTIVKVFLRPEYEHKINNEPISKLGLLLLLPKTSNNVFIGDFAKYNSIYETWEKSLYHYLNNYINSVPSQIKLRVRFSDNTTQSIRNKPFPLNIGELGIDQEDQPFIDRVLQREIFYKFNESIVELQKHLELYPIHIKTESIEYNSIIALPLPEMQIADKESLPCRFLEVYGSRISVDGISVEDKSYETNNYFRQLELYGNINFIGADRPQLSVDRKEIISFPNDYSYKYRDVIIKGITDTIEIANRHIKQYNLTDKIETVNLIWKYIFNRMGCAQSIFVNHLAKSELGNIFWPSVKKLTGTEMTIKELLSRNKIILYQYDHTQLDGLSKMLVLALLISAENIEAIDDKTIQITRKNESQIPETEEFWEYSRYLVPAIENETFKEYDIISNLYPIVPTRLITHLRRFKAIPNSKAVSVSAYGNCYNALFFQDARLVNPGIGIYSVGNKLGRTRDSYIHAFENISGKFQCMDLDEKYPFGKSCVPYLAYIAPAKLTPKDLILLEQIKDDEPLYYEGVKRGWTLLVTNMDIDNIIIQPGKINRATMISFISDNFWETYKDWTFTFLDGVPMTKTMK